MAKKEDNTVLDKKTREKFKQDIMEEINTKYKDDICSSIADDVKRSFDHEYKEEIRNQISSEIMVDIKKDIAKEQKKINRSKNFKIVRLYIYILLLLGAACYMIYCLYVSDNFDLLKNSGSTTTTLPTTKLTTKTIVKDFNWYMKKYGNLLDNIKITNYDLVKGNTVIANLSADVRLNMAYQILDSESIKVDGIINTISEEDMIEAYKTLYGSDEGYSATNFNVNDLSYAYSSNNKSFIAISKDTTAIEPITNKITDIKEENDEVIISTIVAVIKNDKVYNVENLNEPVGDYADLSNYAASLTKIDYVFKKINDSYYISSIVKR